VQNLSPKTLVASAALGAIIATPVVLVFGGGTAIGAVVAALGGAATLALVRRASGPRLFLLAALTLVSVMLGGPLLLAIAASLGAGTGNAGFVGVLFVMLLAGQLVAVPVGLVTAAIHVVVARVTA
jgi:hypothetical protein